MGKLPVKKLDLLSHCVPFNHREKKSRNFFHSFITVEIDPFSGVLLALLLKDSDGNMTTAKGGKISI